jgi:predicted N-acetyltransferase YhbS
MQSHKHSNSSHNDDNRSGYMRIEYLADNEIHLPTVAAWQHAQFGYLNPSVTLAQRTEKLRHSLQKRQLPTTLVSLSYDGAPLGFASVLPATITHKHLGPWLSSVFVPIEHRHKGVASALSLRAVAEAALAGFEEIYLFTPHNESLYARLGWKTFERSELNGLPIALMARPTTA